MALLTCMWERWGLFLFGWITKEGGRERGSNTIFAHNEQRERQRDDDTQEAEMAQNLKYSVGLQLHTA